MVRFTQADIHELAPHLLDALLKNDAFGKADKIQLVEMIMDKHDAPKGLKVQAELSGKTNKYVSVGLKTAD